MRKLLFLLLLLLPLTASATTLSGSGGGTGFATTTAGNISKCLQVSNNSPLVYTFATCSGGSSGVATTSLAATAPIQVTPTASAITYSILAASASQAGSMAAADFQLLHTATTTFSAPLVYTIGTNAVTCTNASSGVTGCLTGTDWNTFNAKAAPFAAYFTWNLLNTFSTSTAATTTSIWTQGVFFASSTKSASQFPYASTTALSVSGNSYLGTVSSGVWNGTSITTQFGGTGLSNPGAPSAGAVLEFDGSSGAQAISAGAQYTVLQSTSAGAGFTTGAVHLDQSAAITGILPITNGGTGGSSAPFAFNSLNTFSTSTFSTTTSPWTQGVFFSSSTKAASQFPYASTTALTMVTGSTTNLIVSSAGGTGTRCAQFAADGTIAANASACAGSFAYPWTYNLLNTFSTSTNSTSTSYWTQGVFFSSSTVASSQFPYASSTSLTILTTASTTNLVVSGITTASTQCLQVSNTGLVTGTNAGCANGTVTSVVAGSGLAGGTISTTGTISVPTIVGTSSSETAANIPFYTSTNAFPALLSGGDSTFTFTSATKKLVFLNGTSTNLSATGFFNLPTTASLTFNNNISELSVNTTAASTSLQVGSWALYATTTVHIIVGTSSPSTAATDTTPVLMGSREETYTGVSCKTDGGTTTVAIGTGVATSTYYQAGSFPTYTTFTTLSSNNVFTPHTTMYVAVGYTTSNTSHTFCGLDHFYNNY